MVVLPISKRGFILPLSLAVAVVAALFIFSYNNLIRNNIRFARMETISRTADQLSLSGRHLMADFLKDLGKSSLINNFPDLMQLYECSGIDFALIQTPSTSATLAYQAVVDAIPQGVLASDEPIKVVLRAEVEDVDYLHDRTNSNIGALGYDPIEKRGTLVITSQVTYANRSRSFRSEQDFHIINMIPGPFARFTLFTSTTPHQDSYSVMAVKSDGEVISDTAYQVFPSATINFQSGKGLRLFHGSTVNAKDPSTYSSQNATDDMKQRGWVFIGPVPDDLVSPYAQPIKDRCGEPLIKIPDGWDDDNGGLFMLGELEEEAGEYKLYDQILLGSPDFSGELQFIGRFWAFHHHTMDGATECKTGPHRFKLFPHIERDDAIDPSDLEYEDRVEIASSWLYPFGTTTKASRTLVLGNAAVGFLHYFFVTPSKTSADYSQYKGDRGIFIPSERAPISNYSNLAELIVLDSDRSYGYSTSDDFYTYLATFDLSGSTQFFTDDAAFTKLSPRNYGSVYRDVALANIFTRMEYADHPPSVRSEVTTIPAGLPSPTPEGFIADNQNIELSFSFTPAPQRNTIFEGRLQEVSIPKSNIFKRVTHLLDLTSVASADKNNEVKCFLSTASGTDRVAKTGVFYIKEDPTQSVTIDLPDMEYEKSLIILIENASVKISSDIIANGAMVSILLTNGNIILDGNLKIEAYLAALIDTDQSSDEDSFGKLISTAAGSYELNIFGGLALTEIGLYNDREDDNSKKSTMAHFPKGGTITYNPKFNHTTNYDGAYALIIHDNTRIFQN